jgi:hypothetical protein
MQYIFHNKARWGEKIVSNKSYIEGRRGCKYLYAMKAVLIMVLSIMATISHAQKISSANDSLLIGTWKGTSICQVRPSPCNDEIAICHITRGAKPNTFHFVMNKMVNEKEEDMGVLDFNFDVAKQTLSCRDNQRNATWNFNVGDHQMDGTLVCKDQLYRIIKLTKADTK